MLDAIGFLLAGLGDKRVNVALNDVLEVTAYMRLDQQNGINVSLWKVTALTGTGATLQAIADALGDHWADEYRGAMTASAAYVSTGVKRFTPNKTDAFYSMNGAGDGANGETPLPGQSAAVVTLRTGLAGRTNRGRKYIPFPERSAIGDDVKLEAGYKNQVILIAAKYITPLVVGGGGNTVTITPGVMPDTPASFLPFETYVVRDYFGTQRRRAGINRPDAQPPQ